MAFKCAAFLLVSVICFCFVVAKASRNTLVQQNYHDNSMVERHAQWMDQYGRTYKDEAEKATRLQIFKENMEYVESINSAPGNRSYKLGPNKFSDLASDEFRALYTGYKKNNEYDAQNSTPFFRYQNVTDASEGVDWRKKGAVTPVGYQSECGCCWAFSAIAAVEGIHEIKSGELVPLSEKQLLDCNLENHGCQGGWMDVAFEYIKENGITSKSEYPYKPVQESCKAVSPVVRITGYEDVPRNDESALLKAVANQPVSVAIAVGTDFQHYSSGVYNGECGDEINHAVTAIGYGTMSPSEDGANTDFWLIKNSWGTTWGESGYMKMARGTDTEGGLCGIASHASYPVA